MVSAGSPRASCVLVGGPGDAPGFDATQYGSILWLVDALGALLPLRGAAPDAVTTVVLGGLAPGAVGPALDRLHQRDPFHPPRLFLSRSLAGASDGRHGDTIAQVHSWFERLRIEHGLLPRVAFGRQKNFLLNVAEYVQRRVPASWAGALQGVPAFVCGSGPSLDVSVVALAPVADRGVVFAADSALRALARHGVQADIAVTTSSRKLPEQCLAPGSEPARIVLASLSPPGWREAIARERCYFLSRSHPTENWLADLGVAPAPVATAENCGITVLELARFLGCAPIYLFGLDLAADAAHPARHHSVDADPAIERNAMPESVAWPRVPGNYSETVPTFLQADWSACDARLASWPAGLVVNVNDRGARLRNTRLVHPRQFGLDPGGGAKRLALAHLALPASEDPAAGRHALTSLGAQGTIGCRALPGLRLVLEQQGVDALAVELRRLFAGFEFSRALGSMTKKLMPHLDVPSAYDAAFWAGMLDEIEELCCLAESVYGEAFV